MRTQTLCGLMYDLLTVQHADLDSIRADVLKNAVDLPADEIGRHSLHAGHMKGVLRDDSRDDRHAVYPVRLEGLEVGLNARTARRVGTCNAEYIFHCSVSSSPLPSKAGIKLSLIDSSC